MKCGKGTGVTVFNILLNTVCKIKHTHTFTKSPSCRKTTIDLNMVFMLTVSQQLFDFNIDMGNHSLICISIKTTVSYEVVWL